MTGGISRERLAGAVSYAKNRLFYSYGSEYQSVRWIYEAALQVNARLPRALKRRFALQLDENDLKRFPAADLSGHVGLLIGPNNWAGQATQWARAANTLPGVDAVNLQFERPPHAIDPPASVKVKEAVTDRSILWSRKFSDWITHNVTHVLFESARPFLGNIHGKQFLREVRWLQSRGVRAAILWHGTDVRSPKLHLDLEPYSYFRDLPPEKTKTLEKNAAQRRSWADELGLVEFVSTPGLLRYRPNAVWLPQVVDRQLWRTSANAGAARGYPPLVVHVPSNSAIKGTAEIDAAAERLVSEGLIRYRRPTNVDPLDMPAVVAEADILVDHIRYEDYGSATIEGLQLGKATVVNLSNQVQSTVEAAFGLPVPIISADPGTIERVLRDLSRAPELRARLAKAGPEFVAAAHTASHAANVLWEHFLKPE